MKTRTLSLSAGQFLVLELVRENAGSVSEQGILNVFWSRYDQARRYIEELVTLGLLVAEPIHNLQRTYQATALARSLVLRDGAVMCLVRDAEDGRNPP